MDTERKTVTLPDGYNGARRIFFVDPIEVDGDYVKLQCAEDGQGYLIRWASRSEVEQSK